MLIIDRAINNFIVDIFIKYRTSRQRSPTIAIKHLIITIFIRFIIINQSLIPCVVFFSLFNKICVFLLKKIKINQIISHHHNDSSNSGSQGSTLLKNQARTSNCCIDPGFFDLAGSKSYLHSQRSDYDHNFVRDAS